MQSMIHFSIDKAYEGVPVEGQNASGASRDTNGPSAGEGASGISRRRRSRLKIEEDGARADDKSEAQD